MVQNRVDFNAIEWATPLAGVRAKVCKLGDKQLRLVEYTRDLEPHWCAKGHIGYVLEGRMEIAVGDRMAVFNPGDGVFLPAGEDHKHMARILTDVVRVIFVEDA